MGTHQIAEIIKGEVFKCSTLFPMKFKKALPKAGMLKNGNIYQMLEHCTEEPEYGLWLTPGSSCVEESSETVALRAERYKKEGRKDMPSINLSAQVMDVGKEKKMWATPNTMDGMGQRSKESMKRMIQNGSRKNRKRPGNLREQVDTEMCQVVDEARAEANNITVDEMKKRDKKMWRTPDNMGGGSISEESLEKMCEGDFKRNSGALKQLRLQDQVRDKRLWPTPTDQDSKNDGNPSQLSRNSLPLNTVVKMLPTPSASMMTSGDLEQAKYHSLKRPKYRDVNSGSLNPTWTEWLMGYAKHYTDLEIDTELFYGWPEEEPGVPRVAVGIKKRVARLKCLGNAVVPQCVELVGRMILKSGLLNAN